MDIYYRIPSAQVRDPLASGVQDTVDPNEYRKVVKLEVDDLDKGFEMMNVVNGDEIPSQIGVRSMMMGDIAVRADGSVWVCAFIEWKRVRWASDTQHVSDE